MSSWSKYNSNIIYKQFPYKQALKLVYMIQLIYLCIHVQAIYDSNTYS